MAPICNSKAEAEQGDCAHQPPSLGSMPEVPAPKTKVLKLASESFSGAFQKAASVLGPGVGESACRHFKKLCFSLPQSCHVGLWSRCFGGCLSGTHLESWGMNPSLLRLKLWVLSSLLLCVGMRLCLSLSYLLWLVSLLFAWCEGHHSASFFGVFRGTCSGYSCWFGVSMGRRWLKIFISCYLELEFCICFPKRFNFFGHFQLRASLNVLKVSSSSHYAWIV